MALARGTPNNFFKQFNDQLSNFLPQSGNGDSDSSWDLTDWLPRTDIFDTSSDDLVFELEIPGFDRDDLDIEVKNDNLIIRGERTREETREGEDRNYYRTERHFGTFQRVFSLPNNASPDEISDKYEDGVLKINMPAPETADKHTIEIN
jgi:HSP20 family protein